MDICKKEVKFLFQNKTIGWIKSELSASQEGERHNFEGGGNQQRKFIFRRYCLPPRKQIVCFFKYYSVRTGSFPVNYYSTTSGTFQTRTEKSSEPETT